MHVQLLQRLALLQAHTVRAKAAFAWGHTDPEDLDGPQPLVEEPAVPLPNDGMDEQVCTSGHVHIITVQIIFLSASMPLLTKQVAKHCSAGLCCMLCLAAGLSQDMECRS